MLINNGRKNKNPERRQDAPDRVSVSSLVEQERGDTNTPPQDWIFWRGGVQTNAGGAGQTRAKLGLKRKGGWREDQDWSVSRMTTTWLGQGHRGVNKKGKWQAVGMRNRGMQAGRPGLVHDPSDRNEKEEMRRGQRGWVG